MKREKESEGGRERGRNGGGEERHPDWKEKIETVFICRRCDCLYKMKSIQKKLLEISEFSKAGGYSFKIQKSIVFLCCLHAKLLQSYLTLCNPMDCSPPGSSVHEDSPGKNIGLGCHALPEGIFLTQRSNPHLLHPLHCRQILYH